MSQELPRQGIIVSDDEAWSVYQSLEPANARANRAPVVPEEEHGRGFSVDAIILGWLDESASRSKETLDAYTRTIRKFRSFVQASTGRDLIYVSPDMDVEISNLAQIFLSLRLDKSEKGVSSATRAQRAAILSSFYGYAIRNRHMRALANPLTLLKRPKVESYNATKALPISVVREKLALINTEKTQGKQDLAILLVLLNTGRRVSEVAGLRREHLERQQGTILLHFEHTKGDKNIDDRLDPDVAFVVEQALYALHGDSFWECPQETPLWVDCYHKSRRGVPLQYQGVAAICKRWLGTSKVHTTRGTFTVAMDEAGASLAQIQQRLQHSNAATTGIYLNKLKQAENQQAGKLSEMLGVKFLREKGNYGSGD